MTKPEIKINKKLNLYNVIHRKKGMAKKIKLNLITKEKPKKAPKIIEKNKFLILIKFLLILKKKHKEKTKSVIPKFSEEVLLCKKG